MMQKMKTSVRPLHVSLVAVPDAMLSSLTGIYDVLTSFAMLATMSDSIPEQSPFKVELVGEHAGPVQVAGAVPIPVDRAIVEVEHADVVILPALFAKNRTWVVGRHPLLVDWLKAMHARGAMICSACSGVFLLAETGLLDQQEATIHWGYAEGFTRLFPNVRLHPERVLVAGGDNGQFVMSGASTSWHDLVLYLIVRQAGVTVGQAVARLYAMEWHRDGLAPYMVFDPQTDHGDSIVAAAQSWLTTHYSVVAPIDEMVLRSGLAERSFKRRFTKATSMSPITYTQRLRIEASKRCLERTHTPIDEIAWQVGYEDPSFFRRLFKRLTGTTPGSYRRRFQVPEFEV